MNKKTLALSMILIAGTIMYGGLYNNAFTNQSGAPAGNVGAPADGNSTCATSCHSGSAVQTRSGLITSDIPVEGYVPGTKYTVTATIKSPNRNRFGFQISPQAINGTKQGTMVITNSNTTQLFSNGKYITHKSGGTDASGEKTWSFDWTAPVSGTGDVTFYGCFNITNMNNSTSGDTIVKTTYVVTEASGNYVNKNKLVQMGFIIYPQPARESFNISNANQIPVSKVSIYGITGELVKEIILNSENNIKIEVGDLPNGIYLLRLYHSNEILGMTKIIKQ